MTITHHLYLRQFGEAEWLSEAELAAHQDRRIGRLLRHALETVPYYSERGLDAVAAGNLPWADIPLMDAETVLDHEVDLRALRLPPEHGKVFYRLQHRDGQDPVAVSLTEYALMVEGCQRMRIYAWHDIDPTRLLLRITNGSDDPCDEKIPTEYWDRTLQALGIKGSCSEIDPAEPKAAILDRLAGLRPHALEGDVAWVAELASLASGQTIGDRQIDVVIATNVADRRTLRAAVGTAFGARLAAIQACGEAGVIAIECPTGNAYHAMSDSMKVEIVDDQGVPVEPGSRGRLVVTPFYNFAMPLLRYDTGLTATRCAGCPCGRSLAAIDDIV
jgi:phenylacetate-CoA ligase